jgi:hypothetical protein
MLSLALLVPLIQELKNEPTLANPILRKEIKHGCI